MQHYFTPDVIDQAHDALWGLGVAFAVVAGRLGFGHLRYRWYQHRIDRRMARHGGMPLEELRELEHSRGDQPDPVTAESIAGAASTVFGVLAIALGLEWLWPRLEQETGVSGPVLFGGAVAVVLIYGGFRAMKASKEQSRFSDPVPFEENPTAQMAMAGTMVLVIAILLLI